MSAHITMSCDGKRHGQPCRGALHTRTAALTVAIEEAEAAGWRVTGPGRDRCPSCTRELSQAGV